MPGTDRGHPFCTSLLALSSLTGGCFFSFGNPAERLDPGQLGGRVVATTGDVVIGARVVLENTALRDESGDDGRFLFAGLPGGTYSLAVLGRTAASPAGTFDLQTRLIGLELRDDDALYVGDVVLRPTGHVRGRVRLTDRGVDDNAGVQVILPNSDRLATTAADGTATIEHLAAGDYDLIASFAGYRLARVAVTVRPDETTDFPLVELEPLAEPGTGVVVGRVRLAGDAARTDHGGSRVTLYGGDGRIIEGTSPTDPAGDYVVIGVPEGVYSLKAERDGFETAALPSFAVFTGQLSNGLGVARRAQAGEPTRLPTLVLVRLEDACDMTSGDDDLDLDDVPNVDEDTQCVCNPTGRLFDFARAMCVPEQRDGTNHVPIARIVRPASTRVTIDTRVVLDGKGSRDFDGDALVFAWSVDGPAGRVAPGLVTPGDPGAVVFAPAVAGLFRIVLRVHDGRSLSLPSLLHVEVIGPNTPPVAVLAATDEAGAPLAEARVLPGVLVLLDAGGSSDADGTPREQLGFTFTVVPDAVALVPPAGAPPWRTGLRTDVIGQYTITVVVSDGADTSTASVVVEVVQPGCVVQLEVCDGLDNDCDGTTDDDCVRVGGRDDRIGFRAVRGDLTGGRFSVSGGATRVRTLTPAGTGGQRFSVTDTIIRSVR